MTFSTRQYPYLPIHFVKGEIGTANLSKQSLMVSVLKGRVTTEQHVQETTDRPHVGDFIVATIWDEYFGGDKGRLAENKQAPGMRNKLRVLRNTYGVDID